MMIILFTVAALAAVATRRYALGLAAAAFAALAFFGAPAWVTVLVIVTVLTAVVFKYYSCIGRAQVAAAAALALAIAAPGLGYAQQATLALSADDHPQTTIEAELAELQQEFDDQLAEVEAQGDEVSDLDAQLDDIEANLDAIEDDLIEDNSDDDPEQPQEADAPAQPDGELQEAAAEYLAGQGFADDEFTFDVDWSHEPDAGPGAFGNRLSSEQELTEFLNADTPESEAARAELRSVMDEGEFQRALDGEGFVPVQLTAPAQMSGNTYLVGDQAVYTDTARPVNAGDVVWIHVADDGNVTEATTRADCANVRAAPEPRDPEPEEPDEPDEPEEPDEPDEPDEPEEPEEPDEPEPKCFDDDGDPVFDENYCADPDEGAEQQDPEDSDSEPTDGYEEGSAEETRDQQDEDREAIEDGEADELDPTEEGVEVPDSEEGGEAPSGDVDTPSDQEDDGDEDDSSDESKESAEEPEDNPDYDGEEPSENPDEGTSDPEDTPVSQPDPEEESDDSSDEDSSEEEDSSDEPSDDPVESDDPGDDPAEGDPLEDADLPDPDESSFGGDHPVALIVMVITMAMLALPQGRRLSV